MNLDISPCHPSLCTASLSSHNAIKSRRDILGQHKYKNKSTPHWTWGALTAGPCFKGEVHMCARLPIRSCLGTPKAWGILLCWMPVPSLVLCYEIISIPISTLTFPRVRGHLAKKPLLVMGEGQGEWAFFFSLCYQNWTSWLLLLGWGAGNSAWSSCGGGGD